MTRCCKADVSKRRLILLRVEEWTSTQSLVSQKDVGMSLAAELTYRLGAMPGLPVEPRRCDES
jgi:hypothetical protein